MLGEVIENNLFILAKVARIYAKNALREHIPIQGKLNMTLFIQKERVLMLGGSYPKELVFKILEIGDKKVKKISPKLTTQGNPFSSFNILNLEKRRINFLCSE